MNSPVTDPVSLSMPSGDSALSKPLFKTSDGRHLADALQIKNPLQSAACGSELGRVVFDSPAAK